MNDATNAQALADALNAYDGEHEWQDVVIDWPTIDQEATESASDDLSLFILTDGSTVEWDDESESWFTGARPVQSRDEGIR